MMRHVFTLIWNRKRTNGLMMAEIFVSFLVLFAVAALGVYTADNWRRPIGFSYDRVWNVAMDKKRTTNDEFETGERETVRQLMLALREFPEIEAAAGTQIAPYQMGSSNSVYNWRGRRIEYGVAEVTDGFKDLLGLQVVEGRWFGPEDDGQAYDPVVINQDMRVELFGNGPAIGENISSERTPDGSAEMRPRRVVGVVAAYREDGELDGMRHYVLFRTALGDAPPTAGERDFALSRRPPANLLIRVRPGTTAAFEERLIRRLQTAAPEWSFDVTTLSAMRDSFHRFAFAPLAAVGLIAAFLMLMVALGLLGVLWQNVTQRTREMGLRRAKGAARVDVQRQILGEIAAMTSLALLAGLLVAIQFPLLDIIYFVEPHVYAISLAIAAAAIYGVALACAWYPSRLAMRVEPAEALRYE
jgi:putative ABC transport system permease protein